MGIQNETIALVVTYNRKILLKECLYNLLNINSLKVVVLDNASTDGTSELFKLDGYQTIDYIRREDNGGGAAGFYYGIQYIIDKYDEYKYIWLMDDDTMVSSESLYAFQKDIYKLNGDFSFLASSIFGVSGEPMNVPVVSNHHAPNGYKDWYAKLSLGLVSIESATFVSVLIPIRYIRKIGLPVKSYFIWGDDTEYTTRLVRKFGNAYLSGKSKVTHKRFNAKPLDITQEENVARLALYPYLFRNNLINLNAYSSKKSVFKYIIRNELIAVRLFFNRDIKYRLKKYLAIQKGILNFLLKRYDYKDFNQRYNIHTKNFNK